MSNQDKIESTDQWQEAPEEPEVLTVSFYTKHYDIPVERPGGSVEPWTIENPYWPDGCTATYEVRKSLSGAWPVILGRSRVCTEMREPKPPEGPPNHLVSESGRVIDAEYRTIPLRCRLGWHQWRVWVDVDREPRKQDSECLRCLRKRSRSVET